MLPPWSVSPLPAPASGSRLVACTWDADDPRGAMPQNKVLAGTAAVAVAGMAARAGRHARGAVRADRSWPGQVEAGLHDLGEVDEVSILPLVERLIPDGSGLHGEPGVSYLVSAGGRRVLFDSGLTGGYRAPARISCSQVSASTTAAVAGGSRWACQALTAREMMASVPGLAARIKVVAVRTGAPMAAWRWMVAYSARSFVGAARRPPWRARGGPRRCSRGHTRSRPAGAPAR